MRPSSNRTAAAILLGLLAFTILLVLRPGGAGAQRPSSPTAEPPRPARVPPAEPRGFSATANGPSSTQTSEFMAGRVAVSVVFLQSSGAAGYCGSGDPVTETWDTARRQSVLSEISQGLNFWTTRPNHP